MKKMIIGVLALLLLVGCVSQPQGQPSPSSKEVLAKELQNATVPQAEDLIKVSGDENVSVVTISAKNVSGRMLFPMKEYSGQFENIGLYSDSFVMLDKSQIKWLDDGESIWLTVMRGDGSGVLFNAIYSNEKVDCSSGKIRILGKEYPLSEMRNGSSFLLDDKWKVALDGKGSCPKRVVIYLDGYFDGLKDNETVSIFRYDNTVLLRFVDLEGVPRVQVIAARSSEQNVQTAQKETINTFIASDEYEGKNYTETMTLNDSGLFLIFNPPLPMCGVNGCYPSRDDYSPEATEAHRVFLGMPNGNWVISRMRKDNKSEEFNLGREIGFTLLTPYSCGNETLNTTHERLGMDNLEVIENSVKLIMINADNGTKTIIPVSSEWQSDGEYIHVWNIAFGYSFCSNTAEVSVFSDLLNLETPANNITVSWQNVTSQNPKLGSIFIPRSSQAFAELAG